MLFDLPTQLYVCNRYLSAVFGSDVVPYEDARKFKSAADIVPNKINILPSWKFGMMQDSPIDLLWNAASFQEMGLETAQGYLQTAASAKNLYLMYNIKYRPALKPPGERGVMGPQYLKTHKELDRSPAHLVFKPNTWLYNDSFWERQDS